MPLHDTLCRLVLWDPSFRVQRRSRQECVGLLSREAESAGGMRVLIHKVIATKCTLKAKAFHYTNARLASVIYPENALTCRLPHDKFVKITNPQTPSQSEQVSSTDAIVEACLLSDTPPIRHW